MPWLDNVTVTKAGPAENGTVYAALIPSDSSWHRWFILDPAHEDRMLAAALTAVAGGKKAQVYLTGTASYSTVNRLYVKS